MHPDDVIALIVCYVFGGLVGVGISLREGVGAVDFWEPHRVLYARALKDEDAAAFQFLLLSFKSLIFFILWPINLCIALVQGMGAPKIISGAVRHTARMITPTKVLRLSKKSDRGGELAVVNKEEMK